MHRAAGQRFGAGTGADLTPASINQGTPGRDPILAVYLIVRPQLMIVLITRIQTRLPGNSNAHHNRIRQVSPIHRQGTRNPIAAHSNLNTRTNALNTRGSHRTVGLLRRKVIRQGKIVHRHRNNAKGSEVIRHDRTVVQPCTHLTTGTHPQRLGRHTRTRADQTAVR